jgi:hypothetical protein
VSLALPRRSRPLWATRTSTLWPLRFVVSPNLPKPRLTPAQFIKSCPKSNPALPVTAFPALTVSKGTVKPGNTITLSFKKQKGKKAYYAHFLNQLSDVVVKINAEGQVKVPKGITGQACKLTPCLLLCSVSALMQTLSSPTAALSAMPEPSLARTRFVLPFFLRHTADVSILVLGGQGELIAPFRLSLRAAMAFSQAASRAELRYFDL